MKDFDRRDEIAFEVEHEDSECEVSPEAIEQPFPLGVLLREEVDAELARRDGEWSAFTAHVFRTIDQAELGEERMSLEDRAIEMMKLEVEGELSAVGHRFEREFKVGVEQKIWRAAREKPAIGARVQEWLGSWRRMFAPRQLGFAMAAAAAIAVAVYNPFGAPSDGSQFAASVDSVSYEGTVTVMSEDGVTVMWLGDDATS